MHAGALRALEFDRIVEAVCRYALTPHGLQRLRSLAPATEAEGVAGALAATAETARFLADNQIALQAGTDLETILDSIGVEGRALDAVHLVALSAFLSSVDTTCASIRRAGAATPSLRRIADATTSFETEIADIRRKIDPSGEVLDDASPELKMVRERLRKQRTRLRGTLESYLRGKDTSKYLQQQIVTDRNGRYVLVVRSEHRTAIPGIVHGSSGSGASLFLEPLSTVEINNDIVALEQQEAEEIRRILLNLTNAFRRRGADLTRTVNAAVELDILQARARFSKLVDGVEPAIAADGRLELRGARHPLLIAEVRRHLSSGEPDSQLDSPDNGSRATDEHGLTGTGSRATDEHGLTRSGSRATDEHGLTRSGSRATDEHGLTRSGSRATDEHGLTRTGLRATDERGLTRTASRIADDGSRSPDPGTASPVPVDVVLIPPVGVLVITGPNTGGKTVALKTAGLLSLMAQAGLLIPVAGGSQIPVYRSIFADIGDEQSISASLSTFSGHIANVVSMDRALALPSLVLLDEAGAGTDPVEGGALAMAIIDHFRRRGATVIATTHYDALKSYASTTEGVMAAGFGFDPQTFAPTYRLNYGSPGSSLALEIANRLGLPAAVIDQARAHRTARETQLAEHLAKIERDMQSLDHERRLAARERQTVAEEAARLQHREQELRNREETFRRKLDERIEERLRDARREIDDVVNGLKTRTDALAAEAERRMAPRLVSTGDTGAARADARAAIEAIGNRLRQSAPQASETVQRTTSDRAPAVGDRVLVGAFGLEGVVQSLHDREADVDVRGKRLRARVDELRVVAPAAAVSGQPSRVRVNVDLQPREGSLTELNVIGAHTDEAVTRVEKFLDEAMLSELKSVRIIHGYGTGQLRRAIGEFLRSHPYVANFAAAPENQGGGGVTVVEFKE
ncbi:MAG TPA: Smr/MutS family protein [Vicinamibacterales bacterium]|nr:Smr/MutS family protein [Vicinamibacterales bacterium]